MINFKNIKTIESDYEEGAVIEWVLSNVCNYSCSYCDPTLYDGSSGQPDLEKSINFFNNLAKQKPGGKLLQLTGGEPTVWKHLPEFLQKIDNSYFVQITTNASRTIRWWESLLEKTNRLDRVSISVHLEYANKEHIFNVVELLNSKIEITVNILASTANWNKVEEFAEYFKNKNINANVMIKPIRTHGLKNAIEYTNYQLEFIKNFQHSRTGKSITRKVPAHFVIDGKDIRYKDALNIIATDNHKFKGWKCYFGQNRFVIWYNGDIYGAMCSTARNNILGNINTDFSPLQESKICEDEYCSCMPDIRIKKHV